MEISVALRVAKNELNSAKDRLSHLQSRGRTEQITATEKAIAAFTNLVSNPVALLEWWESFSPEGQAILTAEFA